MPVAEAIVGDGGSRVVVDVKEQEGGLDYKYSYLVTVLRGYVQVGMARSMVHTRESDYCKMPLRLRFPMNNLTNHISIFGAYPFSHARASTIG